MKAPFTSVALSLLLAGCVSSLTPEAGTSPEAPTVSVPPTVPDDGDLTWFQTQCHGFQVQAPWLSSSGPGKPPPGWTSDPYAYRVFFEVTKCQEFNWGTFSRPIWFATESHNNLVIPANCRSETTPVAVRILHAIWTNDTEVATWIHDRFNVTTHVATFEETVALGRRTISFSAIGATATSSISGPDNVTAATPNDGNIRLFWATGPNSVSYAEWAYKILQDPASEVLDGKFVAPALYAESGRTEFAGLGQAVFDATVTGKIKEFRDLKCSVPR